MCLIIPTVTSMAEDLNSGRTENKSSKWPERESNSGPVDCESNWLTTQPHCLLKRVKGWGILLEPNNFVPVTMVLSVLWRVFCNYCSMFLVAFRIYDMDNDGFISNGELFQVLKMMVGNNLKETQLQQIVDKTVINADKDGDGKISFSEFCAVSITPLNFPTDVEL